LAFLPSDTDVVFTLPTGCVVGRLCELNVNECESSPCLNGGTCIDEVNSFRCQCPDGYYDQLCTSKVNECFSNPCLNGARCVDGVNRYNLLRSPYLRFCRSFFTLSCVSRFHLQFVCLNMFAYFKTHFQFPNTEISTHVNVTRDDNNEYDVYFRFCG